jgi:hypothetical protein
MIRKSGWRLRGLAAQVEKMACKARRADKIMRHQRVESVIRSA